MSALVQNVAIGAVITGGFAIALGVLYHAFGTGPSGGPIGAAIGAGIYVIFFRYRGR